MKIGDMIKLKQTGEVGLIVEKIRKCVPDVIRMVTSILSTTTGLQLVTGL